MSDMSTFVTISNVCNSKVDRSVVIRSCIVALVHIEPCMTLIYILGIYEARDSQNFVVQFFGFFFAKHPILKWLLEVWPTVLTLVCYLFQGHSD